MDYNATSGSRRPIHFSAMGVTRQLDVKKVLAGVILPGRL
jgi:hypothetical protein